MHTYREVTDHDGKRAYVVIFNSGVTPIEIFPFDPDVKWGRRVAMDQARALVSYLNGGENPQKEYEG